MIDGGSHTRRLRQSVDWWMIGIYLALIIIGWVNIYAATHTSEAGSMLDWGSRAGKQFVWILTALGLAALILWVLPTQIWESGALVFYAFVLGLLVLVIFVSSDVKGSHSWFDLGPIRFQPAEISKITTSLLLSLVMSQQWFKMGRMRDFLMAVAIIGLPMLIIVAESETGSALVYAGFIFVLYREGLSGWWLAAIGLVILLFVGTLTAGAYTTILLMIGILVLSCALSQPARLKNRLLIGGGFVLAMALMPMLFDWIGSLVQGQMDKLASRPWVPQADETQDYFWGFVLKIKPLWVLIGLSVAALPFLLWAAYKIKDKFLALCCGVFVAGTIMVFSTDFVFQNVLQPHQRSRIEVLLGLREDLAGVGYNVNQSKIAIGSGGLLGKGFLKGTQTTYGFVPEQSTDFIFCTVGEEWGFL